MISVVCLRKLGSHHGMRLFLTGERFDADDAVGYGLIHASVPDDRLLDEVHATVGNICLGGPNAIVECKKLVRRVPTLSLEDGFAETKDWSKRMFTSDEGVEGMKAFAEKRSPSWIKVDS